ncbi:unnamed protein product [Pieris brassicae]|uniref:Uncharacterized protein n=1 Tax=Pieris brassicae TaxID=7116 RepID=A0A9P0XA24_PIEBR|nr:unnamed protein product [Pieris brassicae]
MFHFCLVNEHKVKEQIASFPSIFLARKNICFIKARHFRERSSPPGDWRGWREVERPQSGSAARQSITDSRRYKTYLRAYKVLSYARYPHSLCSELANDNAFSHSV